MKRSERLSHSPLGAASDGSPHIPSPVGQITEYSRILIPAGVDLGRTGRSVISPGWPVRLLGIRRESHRIERYRCRLGPGESRGRAPLSPTM